MTASSFGSLIGGLLHGCGPAAILWRVGSIVVNAIKGVAAGARPHVRKEGGEIFAPSIAHGNAAATVVRILMVVLVVAAIFGGSPGIVLGRRLPLLAMSVSGESLPNIFALVASAALNIAAPQVAGHHGAMIAAVTQTRPVCAVGYRFVSGDYAQASESLPDEINEFMAHV